MTYKNEDELIKDCMAGAVFHKQSLLKCYLLSGEPLNIESQNIVDILRSEIRTIRELYIHKFNEQIKVDLIPLESPNFHNYQRQEVKSND